MIQWYSSTYPCFVSPGPNGIAKLDLSIMSRGSETADDRKRG